MLPASQLPQLGMEAVFRAHSQSIAIGDVEGNGRRAVDECDTRTESALHTSALGLNNTGHGSLLTSLPSVPGAQLTKYVVASGAADMTEATIFSPS